MKQMMTSRDLVRCAVNALAGLLNDYAVDSWHRGGKRGGLENRLTVAFVCRSHGIVGR